MNNDDVLYSTGNYILHSVINSNGKESNKEYTYIYIYICPNHFAVYLKLTHYFKSTILQSKNEKLFIRMKSKMPGLPH